MTDTPAPTSSGAEKIEKELANVKNDIATLTSQISSALNEFAASAQHQAGRGYRSARSNVDSMVSDMSERGSAVAEAAGDMAQSLEETLEDAIHDRPLATVGIAVALGFLIGVTWRR